MSPRHLVPYLSVVTLFCGTAVHGAVTAGESAIVRVYDAAGLAPNASNVALAAAGAALARASVEVIWKECSHAGRSAGCSSSGRRHDFVLRIMRAPLPLDPRSPQPLGDAFIDTGAASGVLATVYLDRIEWLARTAGVDTRALLGHAIAHEIGHLLLGTTSHSERGLMRAVWSRDEIRRGDAADWTFSTRDIAAIQARRRGVLLDGARGTKTD